LWEPMQVRHSQRCEGWKAWLEGRGEAPESSERRLHESSMEAPETLPDLDDALRSLDG